MKLALVFLVVLPLALAAPVEDKRFLEFLQLEALNLKHLTGQLKAVVHSGMRHDECVAACTAFAGPQAYLCGDACTTALAAFPRV